MIETYSTSPQSRTELSSGDVGSRSALGNLVDRLVFVRTGKVSHSLEGNHLNVELILVLRNQLLRVVRAVKVLSLRVLAWSSVVSADNEVGRTEVLSDDSVPEGFTRSSHAHRKGEKSEVGHTFGVGRHQGLVGPNTGVVVDISGFGETHNRVDEDVGSALTGGTDGELSVGAMHGVSGLEGNDSPPGELVEVSPELSGGVWWLAGVFVRFWDNKSQEILTSEGNVVKVVGRLDRLDFAADVKLLGLVVEVRNSRVGTVVGTHDIDRLEVLVGLVDVGD